MQRSNVVRYIVISVHMNVGEVMFECTAIPLIPEIPDEIIEAVNSKNLIIFVGAGVSNIAGLPLWKKLANRLFEKCRDLNYLDNQQYDITKSKVTDAKQLITIAYELYRKHGNIPKFHAEMKTLLTPKDKDIEPAALDVFDFCKFANATVLTTNADLLLDVYFAQGLIFDDFDNQEWLSSGAYLVKLHGTINKPQTLVFTSSQYLERYSNSSFQNFLRSVFSSGKSVLFIGYGLGEFELLEYMISPFGPRQDNMASKLFVLKPYFSYEEPYKENMDLYFENMHIRQIAYSKDKNGYNQLADVLKHWKAEINSKSGLNELRFAQLIDLVKGKLPDDSTLAEVQHIASESLLAERYFFDLLRTNEYAAEWIIALKTSMFFDPSQKLRATKGEKIIGNKTVRQVVEWPGLRFICDYLSKENVDTIKPETVQVIKAVIANTVSDFCNNEEKMTNDHAVILCAHMLFAFDSNICGTNLFSFLNLVAKYDHDFGSSIYGIVSPSSRFALWSAEDKCKTVELIVRQLLKDSKSIDYFYFDEMTKKYMNSICAESTVEILSFMLNQISNIERDNPTTFWDINSIHYFCAEEDYYFKTSDLILWCKFCIDALSKETIDDAKKTFELVNKTKTIEKIYIYFCSIHFSAMKDVLFSQPVNPFDGSHLYADLYYLIERNNRSITENECNVLLNWITESDFGYASLSEYLKILKYDLLSLLAQAHPYVDPSMYFTEDYSKYPSIDDRLRRKRVYEKYGNDNVEIVSEFRNMNIEAVIRYLLSAKPNNRFDLDDYADALRTDIKNRPSEYYGNLRRLAELPVEYYQGIILSIDETAGDGDVQEILDFYHILTDNVQKTDIENYYIIRQVLDSLNKLILLKKLSAYYRAVYDFTADILATTHKTFNSIKINEGDYYEIIGAISNVWYCVAVTMILRLACLIADKEISKESMQFIDGLTKSYTVNTSLVKETLSKDLAMLYCIDPVWAKSKLEYIFSDDGSLNTLFYSGISPKEVYLLLESNGAFGRFLDKYAEETDRDYDVLCENIVRWMIFAAVEYGTGLNEKLFEPHILRSHRFLAAMFNQIQILLDDPAVSCTNVKSVLISICTKVSSEELSDAEDYDFAIGNLSSCMLKLNEIPEALWICLTYLSNKFKNHVYPEYKTLLEEFYYSETERIIEIIQNTVQSSESWTFNYYQGFDDLIKRIQVDTKRVQTFNEINNTLITKGITRFCNDYASEDN